MTEWDKDKQKADQLMADVEKLTSEKNQFESQTKQLQTQLEVATDRNEELAAQYDEVQAKVKQLENSMRVEKSAEIKLPEIDLENAGLEGINKHSMFLLEQIKNANKRIEQLSIIAEEYQQSKQKQAEVDARNDAQEAVLKQLDTEFGAKYRNEAVKLATKLVEDGKESQPTDRLSAYLLCKKAYKQIKDADVPKKDSIPSDTGRDSIPVNMDGIKDGSFDDVLSQMKKQGMFAGAKLPDL